MVFHINETATTQFTTAGSVTQNQQNTTPAINNRNRGLVVNANGQLVNAPGSPGGAAANATATPGHLAQNTQPINRVATTIVLYMPPQIESNYQAEWESKEIGTADELTNMAFGHGSLVNLFKSFGVSGAQNLGIAGNELTGMSISDALSLATRAAINPHKEVIFNGIGFRSFTFKYRFTPTSEDEATNVDNIIRAFKFYAAPEIKEGLAGRVWIYPGEFDIQYYANGKENLFLNKISTCALTAISVNYTGTGHWAAYRPHSKIQGSPSVCTELLLTFMELEIMTKKRIMDGY